MNDVTQGKERGRARGKIEEGVGGARHFRGRRSSALVTEQANATANQNVTHHGGRSNKANDVTRHRRDSIGGSGDAKNSVEGHPLY